MVNSKMVSVKQKIITLNKSVSYSAYTTTRQIEDESVKAMQIAVVKGLDKDTINTFTIIAIQDTIRLYKKLKRVAKSTIYS